ncbi:uncharacterized protein LOC131158437 [Malania oleifera]|uniref:uncharacterized protein LOC131158437 n=1 Tax=Malania oleifera TaxID=397392 RepID=UPI0025AE525A|nr:uncharacterized protein LOC131158437 [Malania oleifera]
MGSNRISWFFKWWMLFLVLLFFCSLVLSTDDVTGDSLDALLRDFALKELIKHRPHTSILHKTPLPSNLSGIEVSVVRLRSRHFWINGANFSAFSIPTGTLPVPYVRRIAIVYQNLGNWSSHFYGLPGYELSTPVVGFMAFDASNLSIKSLSKIDLNTTGKPVLIHFSNLTSSNGTRRRCAAFYANGTAQLSEMSLPNMCHSHEQGHFSIVVPLPPQPKKNSHHIGKLGLILLGCSGAVILVGVVGLVIFRLSKTQRIEEMEKQADEEVALAMMWIGSSKMPSATLTRTQPVLESGHVP